MNKLSILKIVQDTTVDGPGFRTAIYAAGCSHACSGCHNPQSWSKDNGVDYTIDEVLERIKETEFSNVTFTGGESLMQPEGFIELARRIKQETNKTIWCYTGYRFEQVLHSSRLSGILRSIDVLVDGRYIDKLRNESLRFVGSANQRLIKVPDSLRVGNAVRYDLWDKC